VNDELLSVQVTPHGLVSPMMVLPLKLTRPRTSCRSHARPSMSHSNVSFPASDTPGVFSTWELYNETAIIFSH
jgi:hypothetical protein